MSEKAKSFRVGLIGTGRISDIYLKNCAGFDGVDIVACGSLNMEESRAKAQAFGVAQVKTPDEIIADPEIDAILNLTIRDQSERWQAHPRPCGDQRSRCWQCA